MISLNFTDIVRNILNESVDDDAVRDAIRGHNYVKIYYDDTMPRQ